MRRIPLLVTACLLTGLAPILAPFAISAARADAGNADICASTDDDAFPPQRRIEACGTLIATLQ